MRLGVIRDGGELRYGVVEDDAIRMIPGARSMVDASAAVDEGGERLPLAGVELEAPVEPVRRNVFCVGWNYEDHFAEGAAVRGAAGAAGDPGPPDVLHQGHRRGDRAVRPDRGHASITETLDWEVELAVVIGRDGRDIAEADALDHVLGYTVANDVSARNVQRGHGGQWFRGKSLDGTCPIGPWVVTPDELGPLRSLAITCRVNGETMQSATLGDLHFGVERIIAELSSGLTLLAGDVILTGTPSGVGFARTPPQFLVAGDVVESEIQGIGTLRNEVG